MSIKAKRRTTALMTLCLVLLFNPNFNLPPPNQVTVSPEDMLIATSSMQWLRTQTLEPSGLGLNLSFSTNYSCELGQVTELFCASVFSYVK